MTTLYILYGSATGNAENIAKALAATSPLPKGFSEADVVCEPAEKYRKFLQDVWSKPCETAKYHPILIITSTTGNGDVPENASRFARYIKRRTTAADAFQHCAFAVLGLGDTNYDQFCAAGKSIDKRLGELGGHRVQNIACADEATGLEDVVEPWTSSILETIHNCCFGEEESRETTQEEEKAETTVEASAAKAEPTTEPPLKEEPLDSSTAQTKPLVTPAKPELATPVAPPAAPTKSPSPLFIMYASKTGNAEHIAKDLASTYEILLNNPVANAYFPSVVCCELDQFKKKGLPVWEQEPPAGGNHGLIIICSTTGNGEIPENGSRFERYIKRKTTPKDAFQHCAYAVLGLGDTNYDVFCAAAKSLNKKIAELGGARIKPLSTADEATGLEEGVEPFVNSILLEITNACRPTAAATETPVPKESTPKEVITASEEKEEEKKTEVEAPESLSRGVQFVRKLLNIRQKDPVPEVDHSELPGITSSLSSCELINEDHQRRGSLVEHDAVSSISTNALHYTHTKPYVSAIVGARYLTNTPTNAAKEVTELLKTKDMIDSTDLIQATEIYEKRFPLDGENAEKNGKRVVELTFGLPKDSTFEYQPGDSIGLIVPNPPRAIEFVLSMLHKHHGIDRHQKVSVDSNGPITVEEALRQHIDLSSPVKSKRVVHSLSNHATDSHDTCVLRLLSSKTPKGKDLFQQYIENQRLTVVDLLQDFPSCQSIPLQGLFSMLSGIPPRYYSVSSSPLKSKHTLTVAFSVVDYLVPPPPAAAAATTATTVEGETVVRRIGGVATRYLEILASPWLVQDDASSFGLSRSFLKLPIFPKHTTEFRLPVLQSTPMVLIGPGTGIAPFIGFLQHRQGQREAAASSDVVEGTWRGGYDVEEDDRLRDNNDKNGAVHVYFGCRHQDHDYLYRQELESFAKEKHTTLHTVFSRQGHNQDEDNNDTKKKYVQDCMGSSLTDMILDKKAVVYVCGDGNAMAKDVQARVVELLGGRVENPQEFLDTMKKQHRFMLDIWS